MKASKPSIGVIKHRRRRQNLKTRPHLLIENPGYHAKSNTDIEDMNRHYLCLAKQLASQDSCLAADVMGVPERYASIIENLTFRQIDEISRSHMLLFTLRFAENSTFWNGLASNINTENSDVAKMMLTAMQLSSCSLGGQPNV